MSNASNVSQNAREPVDDIREGARETGNAASEASNTIQEDLQALRDDLSRLAEQVSAILSGKGNAAWRRAKSSVDGVVSDAQAKGQEAVGAVREVSDNFANAIDESIKERPYATLAIALGIGFLFGATWRR